MEYIELKCLNWMDDLYYESREVFGEKYYYFWASAVFAFCQDIGKDTDGFLPTLQKHILMHYKTGQYEEESANMRRHIRQLRGEYSWMDNSILGMKYRCLHAVSGSITQNNADETAWMYGIETALQLLVGFVSDDEITERLKRCLEAYREVLDTRRT